MRKKSSIDKQYKIIQDNINIENFEIGNTVVHVSKKIK